MRSITSGSASIFARRIKKIKKLPLPNVIQNLMLGIQQQIYLIRKVEPITVSSLQEDVVLVELTAGSYTKFLLLKIHKQLIRQKISLEEQDSVALEKIWKELVLSPNKRRPFISAIIVYPAINMELPSYIKYSLDILPYGVRWKTSIFFPTKALLSLSMHIDAWLNSLNKLWPIRL